MHRYMNNEKIIQDKIRARRRSLTTHYTARPRPTDQQDGATDSGAQWQDTLVSRKERRQFHLENARRRANSIPSAWRSIVTPRDYGKTPVTVIDGNEPSSSLAGKGRSFEPGESSKKAVDVDGGLGSNLSLSFYPGDCKASKPPGRVTEEGKMLSLGFNFDA